MTPSASCFYRSSDPSVSYNHTAACFIVRDANGQALSYFYFENEPGVAKSAERQARDARRAALTGSDRETESRR